MKINTYHIRPMNEHEKALQKELCYYEPKHKTAIKVFEEQLLLWLFPMLILFVAWKLFWASLFHNKQAYTMLTIMYLIMIITGSHFRYKKERKSAIAMENQSKPILEEFNTGQVETCICRVNDAFILEEDEDEGPTYILGLGNNFYTILCEHGRKNANSNTPGNIVEIVRLPNSKKVIDTNWTGEPLVIKDVFDKYSFQHKMKKAREGDILEIN